MHPILRGPTFAAHGLSPRICTAACAHALGCRLDDERALVLCRDAVESTESIYRDNATKIIGAKGITGGDEQAQQDALHTYNCLIVVDPLTASVDQELEAA